MANDRPKLDLSAPKIVGGALAAASAAVASSWLGVAGTVIGAVVVSLVASIGSILYTHSLERSSKAIRETIPLAPRRSVNSSGGQRSGGTTTLVPADTDVFEPGRERDSTPAPPPQPPRSIQWRTAAVSAVASLALAAVVLTGLESFVGKPVSSWTGTGDGGGTTVSHLLARARHTSTPGDDPSTVTPTTPPATTPTAPSDSGSQDAGENSGQGQPSSPSTGPADEQPSSSEPTDVTPTQEPPSESDPTGNAPSGARHADGGTG